MEMENNYASKGVGGTALGLSIGALGLTALNGGLGNILGIAPRSNAGMDAVTLATIMNAGCNRMTECTEDHLVNRYEASQSARIAELETEVKLRDANVYTLGEINKLRDYIEVRLGKIEGELCDQRTYNAVNTATIGCIQNQVNVLMGLTKTVIPNTSICPGWGNVTVAPATTTG